MRKYILQGIPLARSTREAWKEYGWIVLRRGSTEELMNTLVNHAQEIMQYEGKFVILNCGLSQFTEAAWKDYLDYNWIGDERNFILFNPGEQIALTRRPGDLRRLMDELLPPRPDHYPAQAWAKGPGHGGENKALQMWQKDPQLPKEWDLQTHIEGQEYRLVTVNGTVVQCSERHGSNGERAYTWRGVREAPRGSIPLVKRASEYLEKSSIIAWDIIADDSKCYILEANTAPGVNSHTARRITEAVIRLVEGDTHQ